MKGIGKKRRGAIVMLILCLIMGMMNLGVYAEGEQVNNTKVTKLEAFSSYKGVQLEWKSAGKGVTYEIYEGSTKKGSTDKTTFYVAVKDDKQNHTYTVYTVVNGVKAGEGVKSNPKGKVIGIKYKVTLKKDFKPECKCHKKATTYKFKAGKTYTAYEFNTGRYWVKINGHKYAFKRIRFKGVKAAGYNSKEPYSAKEMTLYVNKRGLSSKKNTLIVVSTKGQHVYLFKGSKGKWKIDKKLDGGHWMVATGKANTPTPSGLTKIKAKWSVNHGQRYWSVTPTWSFHTNSKSWGALGKPKSGGCVRNTTEHAKYIYNNYKVKTTVCVI